MERLSTSPRLARLGDDLTFRRLYELADHNNISTSCSEREPAFRARSERGGAGALAAARRHRVTKEKSAP